MKKILSISIVLLLFATPLLAEHIKGGELFYAYLGDGTTAGTSRYQLTLKLYIDCKATNPGQLNDNIPLTIFDKANNAQIGPSVIAPMTDEQFLQFDPSSNPCIGNPPTDVCYRVRWYSITVTLNNNISGYTISYQRCCRINNIINLVDPSNVAGATYTCDIPGNNILPTGYKNSSPQFDANDVAAICANSGFTYSFAANEPDGDSLSYQLCSAFTGATASAPNPNDAAPPPYVPLSYSGGFSGSTPLGGQAFINSSTGLITGIAPGITGQYVITACVSEYRNGKLINVHRKDIHVSVSNCIPLKALLNPDYAYCDDLNVSFKNEQLNPAGARYIWTYGDGSKSDTTSDPQGRVNHQYADTGVYNVKLKVILAGGQCVDSTTTKARVFPGFFPGFTVTGTCVLLPLQFTDTTSSRYGVASKWRWAFGDETTTADTSRIKNPTWKYGSIGFKTIQLIVESSKGCIDTVTKQVEVRDKPPIGLPFKDTLICSIDTLQLRANGNGIFSWTPNTNILNSGSSTPLVFPKQTTWYKVQLNENGCINNDSIRVRVVDVVSLFAGLDTTICQTDTIQLRPVSDGLQYIWSPSTRLNNISVKSPLASPQNTITYRVRAIIGKCFAEDDITIRTVPYPSSLVVPDTTICYEDTATLRGSMNGSRFVWSPASTLSTTNSLTPQAFPLQTTVYNLSVFDTLGCPKPGISRVTVTVRNKILAFAGKDTAVVIGQPLQLRGTGADFYQWSPPLFLNNPGIQNPIAILSDNFSYTLKAFTQEGCFALDTINIKVFKTAPDIFVPNAFAPTGRNRILRPIPVGISRIDYFRVYNRWGQLVFQTSESGKGWDGTIAGKIQDSGTFAWTVQGVDYTGKVIIKKGTAILIR